VSSGADHGCRKATDLPGRRSVARRLIPPARGRRCNSQSCLPAPNGAAGCSHGWRSRQRPEPVETGAHALLVLSPGAPAGATDACTTTAGSSAPSGAAGVSLRFHGFRSVAKPTVAPPVATPLGPVRGQDHHLRRRSSCTLTQNAPRAPRPPPRPPARPRPARHRYGFAVVPGAGRQRWGHNEKGPTHPRRPFTISLVRQPHAASLLPSVTKAVMLPPAWPKLTTNTSETGPLWSERWPCTVYST